MTRYIENQTPEILKPLLSKAIWIIDSGFWQTEQALWFRQNISENDRILLPAGEKSKTWRSLEQTLEILCLKNRPKSLLLVGVGGGATLDLAALAAHLYKRGTDFISVPTTVLAMVDASIGGKCAINCLNIKNMIGAMHEPVEHYKIDELLGSDLRAPWIIDGMSEAYKHGLIADLSLCQSVANYLKNPTREELRIIISKASSIKINIVEKDRDEKGLRYVLNLGHTTAHGFEAVCLEAKIELSHGKALAMGLCFEALLMRGEFEALEIANDLKSILPDLSRLDPLCSKAFDCMKHDKKGDGSTIAITQFGQKGQMIPGYAPDHQWDPGICSKKEYWIKSVEREKLRDSWRTLGKALSRDLPLF